MAKRKGGQKSKRNAPNSAQHKVPAQQEKGTVTTHTNTPKASTGRPQTRAQQDLRRAVSAIQPLQKCSADEQKNYVSRAKQFPALVMTVGLAQAVAFSEEKAGKQGALAKSHEKLLEHVAQILDLGQEKLVDHICQASTTEYLHMTRRVLQAWVYYRRFADSMLKSAESAESAEKEPA